MRGFLVDHNQCRKDQEPPLPKAYFASFGSACKSYTDRDSYTDLVEPLL